MAVFDVHAARAEFPILSRQVHGKPLVYLDSAASAQKPRAVIDAMTHVMEHAYSNVHRGLHTLGNEVTEAFEAARRKVAGFIGCDEGEVVFTKGGTEAINLVASGLARSIRPGDEILLTEMEHHANIVPWHFLREHWGAVLKFAPVRDDGSLDVEGFRALLSERTKVVAFTHMSNVLGTRNPVAELTRLAHEVGAQVLIDGCQG
ncbi:MAG: aminotransferase class V-fold PLP-dependent enzyme, partial [Phenylobacterium sp.]